MSNEIGIKEGSFNLYTPEAAKNLPVPKMLQTLERLALQEKSFAVSTTSGENNMPNFRNDHYYDPPEELDAEFCESCGKEMEWIEGLRPLPGYFKCVNVYCPDKFELVDTVSGKFVVDLAKYVVELEHDLDTESHNFEKLLHEVDTLRSQVRKLTPSQSNCDHCRCGKALPEVADDEIPYEFCSQKCKGNSKQGE